MSSDQFNRYARYYNLIYQDKQYLEEAKFVKKILSDHSCKLNTVLELGCGTGKHAICFSDLGFSVFGIDLSPEMIEEASQHASDKISFDVGDVRNFRVNKKFDSVISLFHVASYQNSNQDLIDYFSTARAHLDCGGLFFFDCWYGPAVLVDPPHLRVKRFEDERIKLLRIAEPDILYNQNCVDVKYQIIAKDKKENVYDEFNETHRMRYLFKPEIENFLTQSGFELVTTGKWMSDKELGSDSWFAYFLARAK